MRIKTVLPSMTEYQRRIYLSAEAKSIGYGGISLVSRLSGVSRQTLTGGVKELDDPKAEKPEIGRSRKAGAGRKAVWEKNPEVMIFSLNLLKLIQKVTLCYFGISVLISTIAGLFLAYLLGITVLTDKNNLRFYDGSSSDFLCDRSIYGILNWGI
jgi:hypothetical protein